MEQSRHQEKKKLSWLYCRILNSGREVVPFDIGDIAIGGGIHCITQQQPVRTQDGMIMTGMLLAATC